MRFKRYKKCYQLPVCHWLIGSIDRPADIIRNRESRK
jgi:hypothetical protein